MAANVENNLVKLGCNVISYLGPESIKTRFIDSKSGYQILRVDEDCENVDPLQVTDIDFHGIDAIVISDYNKGYITYDIVEIIRNLTSCPIFIDTKKPDLSRFKGCFIKINSLEFSNRTSESEQVIVTLGKHGARWQGRVYPVPTVNVSDVCGAGDTFLASLAYFYLLYNSIEEAIILANKASAVTVQHLGTYSPSIEEINWIR
jgi:D-beta-D-heptose 7-phosphate kinase/D-beta-D-heptose 1-phosphate adenosyltransferase